MPASFASQWRGRAVLTALGLLSLSCWDARASPILSPDEDNAAIDLRFERPMVDIGQSARWDVSTNLQLVAGRDDQSTVPSGSPGLAATPLSGAMSFPDAASELATQPRLASLPERASRETLRDVLRSLATIHREEVRPPPAAPARRPQSVPAGEDVDEDVNGVQRAGLAELMLDSEIAGAMLRSLVTIKSTDSDGTTFAILGAGDFVFDVSPAAHAAHITELSSGASFGTTSSYSVYSDYTASGGDGRVVRQRVNVVRMVWEWCLDNIFSPAGLLLSMITLIVLFFWVCVKAVRSDRGAGPRLR